MKVRHTDPVSRRITASGRRQAAADSWQPPAPAASALNLGSFALEVGEAQAIRLAVREFAAGLKQPLALGRQDTVLTLVRSADAVAALALRVGDELGARRVARRPCGAAQGRSTVPQRLDRLFRRRARSLLIAFRLQALAYSSGLSPGRKPAAVLQDVAAYERQRQAPDQLAVHDSLAAAEKLYDKLETSIGSFVTSPRRGRVVPVLRAEGLEMYRELVTGRYRVLFRPLGRDVVLLGVFDGRRDLAELLAERAMGDVL